MRPGILRRGGKYTSSRPVSIFRSPVGPAWRESTGSAPLKSRFTIRNSERIDDENPDIVARSPEFPVVTRGAGRGADPVLRRVRPIHRFGGQPEPGLDPSGG